MPPKRFLFVAPPFAAHVNPLVSISSELLARGQKVGWVTYDLMRPLLPEGAEYYRVEDDDNYWRMQESTRAHSTRFLAEGLVFFFRDIVLPLTQSMSGATESAVTAFRPDVMVVDQHALAGALIARKLSLTWATSAPSAQLLTNALDEFKSGRDWLIDVFATLQKDAGLEPVTWPDRSPYLILVYTTRALVGEGLEVPPHYRLVGPATQHRKDNEPFPWQDLHQGPNLLVSLGTLFQNQGARFFNVLVEALADQPVQVIVSTPPELIPSPPPNFIVRRSVPLSELWLRIDALLCHAGTIVNEGLAQGIPAVVAPIAMEQSIFAQQVVDAGAGVRIRFGRVGPRELRRAVFEVLDNPAYRQAASVIRDSFAAAGGTSAAADALMALAK